MVAAARLDIVKCGRPSREEKMCCTPCVGNISLDMLRAVCSVKSASVSQKITLDVMSATADDLYVLNLKDRGRLHKVRPTCLKLPRREHRTCCGWRFGQVGALPTKQLTEFTTIQLIGKPCRRCFPRGLSDDAMPPGHKDPDSIEQYD